MSDGLIVKRGASTSKNEAVAAEELFSAIHNPEAALTLFFCSPEYDLAALGRELRARFGDAPLVGCTTAGEITPVGYLEGALTGLSIGGKDFHVVLERIEDLKHFRLDAGEGITRRALSMLAERAGSPSTAANTFGFLLVDGLSMQEEMLVSSLYGSMNSIQLIGGSAGDGTRFGQTFLYHQGEFRSDCAVFALMQTSAPFRVFKTEHFVPAFEKMVVTKADPARRIVTEINGEPAGREYARVVGLEVDKLTPLIFANYPVVVRVGGVTYVRSIQKVNEDESLTFFCAIDDGIVLTVARGVDMIDNLEAAFERVRADIGEPELVLGCDCILRFIEAGQGGFRSDIGRVMAANNVVGFSTYGEQINAMHVNQTFTGIALGRRRDAA